MTQKEKLHSKALYKLALLLFKWIPATMALAHVTIIFTSHYLPIIRTIAHILGLVAAPLLFLLIGSYLFKFCWYHRFFIFFVIAVEAFNVTWYYTEFLPTQWVDDVYIGLLGVAILAFGIKFCIQWKAKKNCAKP